MRSHVSFLLNGTLQRVEAIAPTTTLLQWLRRVAQLTGTKEGCAEGGCGACTVVLGSLDGGTVRYRTVNACLVLLPMLEGLSVRTVEGVAGADGALHPCQQSLVDCHGSQCGFCTPGFVMSLYALHMDSTAAIADRSIDDALSGNLCRCTGYVPIVAAAHRMLAHSSPLNAERRAADAAGLAALAHGEAITIEHGGQQMFVPATEDELARLALAHPEALLISGATDVGIGIAKQTHTAAILILMGRVASLRGCHEVTGAPRTTVFVGAGTPHAEAMEHLQSELPALGELWRRFGGSQVRNIGTVGGNIANGSPIGDLAPALMALGATLHLRRGSERRTLPLEDFFLGYGKQDRRPGEFLTGVSWGVEYGAWRDLRCYKVSKRFDDDISAVCGAFMLVIDDEWIKSARVAFGGMAATPRRARKVEALLIGRRWDRTTVDAACVAVAQDFQPISDVRASADYRLQVARNLLVRAFIELSGTSDALVFELAALDVEVLP